MISLVTETTPMSSGSAKSEVLMAFKSAAKRQQELVVLQNFFCVMKVSRDRPLSCREYGHERRLTRLRKRPTGAYVGCFLRYSRASTRPKAADGRSASERLVVDQKLRRSAPLTIEFRWFFRAAPHDLSANISNRWCPDVPVRLQ
ncbi:hypothetical protein [Mesorhizobium sp. WSM3866]|uniref:hypothetical protein n=1 Tax=Mesorhizobium sp. WSM3866 TaxID=422271 RepID=UPI00159704D0|nr:hypothetical protein [Mesorhizobium sp. WSM3866]